MASKKKESAKDNRKDPIKRGAKDVGKPAGTTVKRNRAATKQPPAERSSPIRAFLREHRIGEVEAVIPDLAGVARGKLVPAEKYVEEEGMRLPESIFLQTVTGEYPEDDSAIDPSEIDILLRNYPTAMKQINRALRKNQYTPKAYFLKGQLYRETGDTTLALSSYKTATEVDPNYYDAFMALGLLYTQSKNDLGRQYFDAAIAIKPKSIEAWYGKAMFLQESGYRDAVRYQQAFACYDTILKIESGFSAANFNKGFIHLEYLQHYDSAATFFSQAITQYPEYYQAFYNRGLCNESLGNREQAERDYRQALALMPTFDEAAIALNRVLGGKR